MALYSDGSMPVPQDDVVGTVVVVPVVIRAPC